LALLLATGLRLICLRIRLKSALICPLSPFIGSCFTGGLNARESGAWFSLFFFRNFGTDAFWAFILSSSRFSRIASSSSRYFLRSSSFCSNYFCFSSSSYRSLCLMYACSLNSCSNSCLLLEATRLGGPLESFYTVAVIAQVITSSSRPLVPSDSSDLFLPCTAILA